MVEKFITTGGLVIRFDDIKRLFIEENEKCGYTMLVAETEKLGFFQVTNGDIYQCQTSRNNIAEKMVGKDLDFYSTI